MILGLRIMIATLILINLIVGTLEFMYGVFYGIFNWLAIIFILIIWVIEEYLEEIL